MTFTLRTNNFKMDKGEKLMQAKEWENNKKADTLTVYKEEKKADYFSMDESEDCAETITETITVYTSHVERGTGRVTTISGNSGKTKITLGWKLEAVRGYVQNEQEKMNSWWENFNSDQCNELKTAFIDLI